MIGEHFGLEPDAGCGKAECRECYPDDVEQAALQKTQGNPTHCVECGGPLRGGGVCLSCDDPDEADYKAAEKKPHARFVAFIDGAFGGRLIEMNPDYEAVMREAAASDPRLARELKRRGWLKS